jgi:hypothetical protein
MQNKQLDENQLQALLRLKRYEQPPAGYFENLLDRVHRRQREEMLRRPAWQLAFDRVRAFFAPLQMDWRHAGAMAAILVAGIFAIRVAIPERAADSSQIAQVATGSNLQASAPNITLQPAIAHPVAAQENRHVQRDPSSPVRFIIDAQPVSYETTQIRF